MEYLLLIRPSSQLIRLIEDEPDITTPRSGLHCTVLKFEATELDDGLLSRLLARKDIPRFNIEVIGNAMFDKNSRVLLLSKPEELLELHRDAARKIKPYTRNRKKFDQRVSQYYLENYNPHITLPGLDDGLLKHDYLGVKFEISRYYLLKKSNGVWINVQTFPLVL